MQCSEIILKYRGYNVVYHIFYIITGINLQQLHIKIIYKKKKKNPS